MNNSSKVTVIIPTYKRPKYLKRAINSVLNQTYTNIEIIVVDDNNSMDEHRIETEQVMFEFEKIGVKYIKHEYNRNGAAARNTGIRHSTGDYIAFLDDDDEFLPNKIENQVAKMDFLDSSWGACYTSYKKINSNGKIQFGDEKREGYLLTEALMRSLYIGSGSNLFVRKIVVDELNGFDESFNRNQDLEFLVRVLEKYKIAYLDTIDLLVHYEVRDNKRTYKQLREIDEYYILKFKDRINSLNEKDKIKVYNMIALDNFRNSLSSKFVLDGIFGLFNSKVNAVLLIRYIFYLIRRMSTGKSYGFIIR